MQQNLEFELGENAQSLSERYHHTAERLSRSFTPGSGGLTQVQQLFLTASWFKSEALFIESWHALSSTIREAQELGMNPLSDCGSTSKFDLSRRNPAQSQRS
jgi:hypothetical protein